MTYYTPTTEEVRQDFAYPWEGFKQDKQGRLDAFDRWHADEIRKAKEQAWEEGLLSAGLDPDYTMQIMSTNPYTEES